MPRKVNPWAICHSKLGKKKTDKFERCVMNIKSKHGIKEARKKTRCWKGYRPTPGKTPYSKGSCMKEQAEFIRDFLNEKSKQVWRGPERQLRSKRKALADLFSSQPGEAKTPPLEPEDLADDIGGRGYRLPPEKNRK